MCALQSDRKSKSLSVVDGGGNKRPAYRKVVVALRSLRYGPRIRRYVSAPLSRAGTTDAATREFFDSARAHWIHGRPSEESYGPHALPPGPQELEILQKTLDSQAVKLGPQSLKLGFQVLALALQALSSSVHRLVCGYGFVFQPGRPFPPGRFRCHQHHGRLRQSELRGSRECS